MNQWSKSTISLVTLTPSFYCRCIFCFKETHVLLGNFCLSHIGKISFLFLPYKRWTNGVRVPLVWFEAKNAPTRLIVYALHVCSKAFLFFYFYFLSHILHSFQFEGTVWITSSTSMSSIFGFFFFTSSSCTVHGTWTMHRGKWTVFS